MAITYDRTRRQTRQSVGLALNLLDQSGGSVTLQVTGASSVGAWTVAALTLTSSTSSNEQRGKWTLATAGSSNASSNVGLIRRVSGSTSSNGRMAFLTDWPAAADTSTEFELWHEGAPPTLINDFINQSITEAARKGAIAVADLTIHTGGGQRTFPFTTGSSLIGVQEVEYRSVWQGEKVTTADNAFSSESGVDVVTDSEDHKEGSASNRITIPSGHSSASVAATDCFSAIDIRGMTHLEFWMKTNVTVTSSALRVRLGEGSTNRETLNVPAMNADSWTYHRIALGSPEVDSAISRFIVMSGASDAGSVTVWNDDVTVTRENTEEWTRINPRFWGLDHATRALVLERDADVPYALLRITGRRLPNLMTSDTNVSDLEPEYLVKSTAAKVIRSRIDLFGGAQEASKQADYYEKLAQMYYLRMRTPSNVRWVESS